MSGFENVGLSLADWIAYGLGVVLTSVLGVVPMAPVFHSDRNSRARASGACGARWTGRLRRARLSRACRLGRDEDGAVVVDVGEQLDEAGPLVDRVGPAHRRVVELPHDLEPVRLGVGGHRVALALHGVLAGADVRGAR